MPKLNPHIFRAYDIRGKAGTELTEEACFFIGRAFGEVLQEKYGKEHPNPTVAVGRDARTHSLGFEAAIIEGLVTAGCAVEKIGQTPSPVNYFTICNAGLDAGAQITASHNPKEDNGIKLQIRNAEAFSGEDLQLLRRRIEKQGSQLPKAKSQLPPEDFDAITPYIEYLTKTFQDVGVGKKIVVDSGNGVAGPTYCEILKRVGCEITELYTEPDGNFPNHPADPSKHETLKELQEKVREVGADCGFGFDGDGDRVGVVDEKGQIVTADQTLLLLAKDHLSRYPGGPVIFTVSNSGLLESEIKKWGGRPVMCKVGHSFVEHAMREEEALLGGEQSGHFFCGEEYFGFDDALVAALRILKILASPRPRRGALMSGTHPSTDTPHPIRDRGSSFNTHAPTEQPFVAADGEGEGEKTDKTGAPHAQALRGGPQLSNLIQAFPKVFQTPEWRPHCPDDKKVEVVLRITEHFQKDYPVATLDGARIDFGDGAWAGIRYSNTSPCLSVCIEARSEQKLKEIEKEILEHVIKFVVCSE